VGSGSIGTVLSVKADFNIVVEDEYEPCWVASGSAVLWQQDTIMENGKETLSEWMPISPQYGLPITTAGQLAAYLRRKPRPMRLRPYMDEAELLPTYEPVEKKEDPPSPFECTHSNGDVYGCVSWKAYLIHCRKYNEVPDTDKMPEEVKENAKQWEYYDALCDKGWNEPRPAKHHVRAIVAELDGVKVYVLGNRVIVTKQDLYF